MANYDDELEEDDDDEDDEGDDNDQESSDNICYKCVTSGEDFEFNGVFDRIELDITTAFLCAGCDLDDQAVRHDLSERVQDELFAFFSPEAASQRVVNVDKGGPKLQADTRADVQGPSRQGRPGKEKSHMPNMWQDMSLGS